MGRGRGDGKCLRNPGDLGGFKKKHSKGEKDCQIVIIRGEWGNGRNK